MQQSDMMAALASTLPAGIDYDPGHATGRRWDAQMIAEFQAKKLIECGYVISHPDVPEGAPSQQVSTT